MLDVKYLHPCFCIGTYVPKRFWDDENIPDDGYTAFILDIKYGESEAIRECIDLLSYNLTGFDAVTAVPPSQVGTISGIQQSRERACPEKTPDRCYEIAFNDINRLYPMLKALVALWMIT
jgi:hypothetical protein